MKALPAPLLALLLAASCATSEPARRAATSPIAEAPRAQLTAEQSERLRQLMRELARAPLGTGAVLTVSLDGRLHSLSAGTRRTDGSMVTEQTQFNVASVSKLLTAARIHDLSHQRRIRLDDRLKQHLPGVEVRDASGDRAGEVVLGQLLEHRAGLPHQPGALDPARVGSAWGDPALLTKLASSWSLTPAGEPGRYAYSNVGYALLGAVVERLEEKTFAEAMRAYLRQLGMTSSTFWPSEVAATAAYGRVEKDGATQFLEPAWYGSRYALPFTGLWASMPDLARFGQALLVASTDPGAALHSMTVFDGEKGHGRGPVFRQRSGLRSLEHDGGAPGFLAWLVVIPERSLVLAVACNADGESAAKARRFAEVIEEALAVVQPTGPAAAP